MKKKLRKNTRRKPTRRKNTRRKNTRRKTIRRKNTHRKNSYKLKGGKDLCMFRERVIDLENLQELVDLLKKSEVTKHAVVISGHHGEMLDGNFYIPDGIEILMKASIGKSTHGYPSDWEKSQRVYYNYLNAINGSLIYGDIYIDGCINPSLISKLNLTFKNNQNLNFKISGKSSERVAFPEFLKEDMDPKKNLTIPEIQGIEPEILRQYYANDVQMVFTNEEFYKNHGLLFKIKCGRYNNFFNVRLSLLSQDEKVKQFNGRESLNITDRVIPVLKSLNKGTVSDRTPNGHEFLVLFSNCRVRGSDLNREISKKTDKSIECWLKWNRELIIRNYTEDLYNGLSEYLKKNFSSMNEFYDFFNFLTEYSKNRIIEYILFAFFLSMITDGLNDLMKQIIEKANAIISMKDNDGMTPLFHAVLNGNEDITKLLIDAGAKVNIPDEDKMTPLFHAVLNGNEDITKLLIDAGAKVNIPDDDKRTPILYSALSGNNEITKLLIDKGAKVNIPDNDGKTPILYSVLSGNNEITELLIGAPGAKVNIPDDDRMTPLFHAVLSGNEEITKLLIDKGAKVNIGDKDGKTPILYSVLSGNNEITELLIGAPGAKVNIPDDDRMTPLFHAVLSGNEEITKLLIDKGAKVNIGDKDGKTPLIHAVLSGNEEIIELLIDKGGDINLQDKDGNDTKYYAGVTGNQEIIQIIQEAFDSE